MSDKKELLNGIKDCIVKTATDMLKGIVIVVTISHVIDKK